MENHYYYGSPATEDDYEDIEELQDGDSEESGSEFDILRDIDTVLFFRVNSFFHSVTNRKLESRHLELPQMNESAQMPNDEKQEFITGKINFFFRQMKTLLSPQQQQQVHVIHQALNQDLAKVMEYFHQQACLILSPQQAREVRASSLDLIRNVQIEMERVRGLAVIGGEPDEHAKSQIISERDVIQEHARHFLDRVENIITLSQWKQFSQLTTECKNWMHNELHETQKALTYMLSSDQIKIMNYEQQHLVKELGSLVDEYAIVRPSVHTENQLTLSLREDINSLLEYSQEEEPETWVPTVHFTDEPSHHHSHGEDLVYLQQQKNSFEFDEEIEEMEDSMPEGYLFLDLSEENAFLGIILLCVLSLFIFLFVTRKKRANRGFDSQVSKYRTLNSQIGPGNAIH